MAYSTDTFLAHYGIPGMKWGKRRTKHTEKRSDYKRRIATEQQTHEQEKLRSVIVTSMKKGENVLVKTQIHGDYVPTIMTGKQFVEHAGAGALLNARTTDVFATLDKKLGQFVLNEAAPNYVPTVRR